MHLVDTLSCNIGRKHIKRILKIIINIRAEVHKINDWWFTILYDANRKGRAWKKRFDVIKKQPMIRFLRVSDFVVHRDDKIAIRWCSIVPLVTYSCCRFIRERKKKTYGPKETTKKRRLRKKNLASGARSFVAFKWRLLLLLNNRILRNVSRLRALIFNLPPCFQFSSLLPHISSVTLPPCYPLTLVIGIRIQLCAVIATRLTDKWEGREIFFTYAYKCAAVLQEEKKRKENMLMRMRHKARCDRMNVGVWNS